MHLTTINSMTSMAISNDERAFFVELGNRVAELRKVQGITQIQLAEVLQVSQQTITSYEVGRRRIPASALPVLSKVLKISTEELLGESQTKTASKRGPASKLQRQVDEVGLLPKSKQKFISDMLDALIKQQQAS